MTQPQLPTKRATYLVYSLALVVYAMCLPSVRVLQVENYDEGVYFCEAVLFCQGAKPYSDFFLPHPPGLIALNALLLKAGVGLTGLRIVAWTLGLLLIPLVRWICWSLLKSEPRLSEIWASTAAFAILLLYSSAHIYYVAPLALTDMPAIVLGTLAVAAVAGCKPFLGAAAVCMASLFRVQAVVLIPGLLVLCWFCDDLSSRFRSSARFLVAVIGLLAAAHGLLAYLIQGYYSDAFRFHATRPSASFTFRLGVFRTLCEEPLFMLGVVSAALLLRSPNGRLRGFGGFVVITTLLITFFGKSIVGRYYVAAFPLLAIAASLLLMNISWAPARGLLYLSALILVLQAGPLTQRSMFPLRDHSWEHSLIARVSAMEARKVLSTTPVVVIRAGKEVPNDYYANDPYPFFELGGFPEWFSRVLRKSDGVLVNDEMLNYMSDSNYLELAGAGKPIVFVRPADALRFRDKLTLLEFRKPATGNSRTE